MSDVEQLAVIDINGVCIGVSKGTSLCVSCQKEGKFVKATVVDHVILHRRNYKLFWDESNWQALCKHCHDVKTMTEDRLRK